MTLNPLEFVAKAAAPDAEISAEPRPIASPGNDGSLANVALARVRRPGQHKQRLHTLERP